MREFNPDTIVLSHSRLSHLAESPLSFKYKWQEEDYQPTDAMILGSLTHALLTQPEKVKTYHKLPEGFSLRSNDSKKEFAKIQVAGLTPMKHDDYNNAFKMANAIKANPIARDVVRFEYKGIDEYKIEWIDKRTGLKMKGFIDRWIPEKSLIIEFKTAADASPRKYARSFFDFGYDRQTAIYFDGLTTLDLTPKYVVSIVVESKPPFNVSVFNIPAEVILVGRARYEKLLDFFIKCRAENLWDKSYDIYSPTGIFDIEVPTWMK